MPAPMAASSRTCWSRPRRSTAPAATRARRRGGDGPFLSPLRGRPRTGSSSRARFRGAPRRPRRRSPAAWPRSRRRARRRSRSAPAPAARPSPTRPATRRGELIDAAGCRGLRRGGAMVSEKHTNFLINTGDATAADIEGLGEEVRRRVYDTSRRRPRMGNPPRRPAGSRRCHGGSVRRHEHAITRRGADGRLVGRARGLAGERRANAPRRSSTLGYRVRRST